MTATDTTVSTLLVAIDISKHRHEVLIGVPGKKRRRRLTITNTLDDFRRLAAILMDYGLSVRIGFEATGNYHRPLAHHLGQAGFDLKLVSSVGLARTREALHNSWDKNDPKDAQVGVCQRSCPLVSCGVSDFGGADIDFWVEPDRSGGLPVAGLA